MLTGELIYFMLNPPTAEGLRRSPCFMLVGRTKKAPPKKSNPVVSFNRVPDTYKQAIESL